MEYQPLAIEIRKLKLTNYNATKAVDIDTIMLEMNIYEDMMSPTMYGNIIINDALELLAEFPIIGQEKIEIEFRTDKESPFFKHSFRTYKVAQINRTTEKAQNYVLHFASPEVFSNVQRRVVNGYTGSIDAIAQRVYNNYIQVAGKPFISEPTTNSRTIAFPTLPPFDAMKMLREYAVSQSNLSSNYVFFEDRDGFYFNTIDSYISRPSVQAYHYGPANYVPEIDSTGIREYEIVSYRDTLKHIQDGFYGQKLVVQDIATKSFKEREFDYEKDFDKIEHTDKNPLNPEGTSFSSENVVLLPTCEYTERYEDYLLQNISSMAQLDSIVLEVSIHGDERRKPGDIIEFNIANATDIEELENKPHKYLSGNYLISRVRHKINGTQYSTNMQIVKNAARKKIEAKNECADTF